MSYIEQAGDPNLTPSQFKALLDIEDEFVYETLDLNEQAATRYLQHLSNMTEPNYFPPTDLTEEEAFVLAEQNNHLGQYALGDFAYNRGDLAEAERFFLAAAENGNFVCMLNFALITKSPEARHFWLRKSALRGFPNSQRELARDCWRSGDTRRALLWLGCASRRGLIAAFSDLGALHWELGNQEEAIQNWRIAASAGDKEASTNLSNFDTTIFDDEEELFDENPEFTDGRVIDFSTSDAAPSPSGNPKPQESAQKAVKLI